MERLDSKLMMHMRGTTLSCTCGNAAWAQHPCIWLHMNKNSCFLIYTHLSLEKSPGLAWEGCSPGKRCYRSSQICPFARISYASMVDVSSSPRQRDQVILTQLTLLLEPPAKVSLSRQAWAQSSFPIICCQSQKGSWDTLAKWWFLSLMSLAEEEELFLEGFPRV